jgi:hypothetical protein
MGKHLGVWTAWDATAKAFKGASFFCGGEGGSLRQEAVF